MAAAGVEHAGGAGGAVRGDERRGAGAAEGCAGGATRGERARGSGLLGGKRGALRKMRRIKLLKLIRLVFCNHIQSKNGSSIFDFAFSRLSMLFLIVIRFFFSSSSIVFIPVSLIHQSSSFSRITVTSPKKASLELFS